MFYVDVSFWVATIGKETDRGDRTRGQVVAALVKVSSLSREQAAELVDTLVRAGKIRRQGTKLVSADMF